MNIDQQLQRIQEDTIIEIEPITTGAVVITGFIIAHLVSLFLLMGGIIKSTKVDPKYSKKITDIIKDGKKYTVHIVKDKSLNAFALPIGNHIFIHDFLMDHLTEDERIAVLLHEAYHSKQRHSFKELAYKYPLLYLALYSGFAISTVATGGSILLALLIMTLITKVGMGGYKATVGRIMEYKADSYAAKFGYGDALINALKKIEDYYKQFSMVFDRQCGSICRLVEKVDELLREHPETRKRVEKILKTSDKLYSAVKSGSFAKIKNIITKKMG